MKWNVIVRPRAEADPRSACQWYNAQSAGLGDEFLEEVKRAVVVLEDYADQRPLHYRGFRRLLTQRFPYKLFYWIERDRVIVFRILHAKRNHPSCL